MNRPSIPIASNVGRVALEMLIIVTGVLIALAAQSWWENRALDHDRRQALELLDDDLEELDRWLGEREEADSVQAALQWFLVEDETAWQAASDEVVNQRFGQALWSFGFQIGDAGSEGLIPSYADLKPVAGAPRRHPGATARHLTRRVR